MVHLLVNLLVYLRTFKDTQHVYFLLEAALGGSLIQAPNVADIEFVQSLGRCWASSMSSVGEAKFQCCQHGR